MFPDLTQFRRRKIRICHPKTKNFESKSTAENNGRNRKSKYIHKMVVFYVTNFEISRRRALNCFWIELQFMPSNWIGIELNKNSLNRTCLPPIPLIHILFGYRKFFETQHRRVPLRNFSALWDKKIDWKSWHNPLKHKIFRYPKIVTH